jgi:hypothetical protein
MILFIGDTESTIRFVTFLHPSLSTTKVITTADEVRQVKGEEHIEVVARFSPGADPAAPEPTPDQVEAIKLAMLSNASIIVRAATEMANRMGKMPPSALKPLTNPLMRSHE